MKKLWTSFKKQKNLWIFLSIILIFGIGVGLYFGGNAKEFMKNTLLNYAMNKNEQAIHFTIPHFTILALLFTLSFFLIGIPLGIAYLFFEGMTIGFCFSLFVSSFQLNGFLYIFFFFLLTKSPFLIIFFLFFYKILLIGKAIISWIIYKNNKKDYILHIVINCFILIILLLIYDLLLDYIFIKGIQAMGFLLN